MSAVSEATQKFVGTVEAIYVASSAGKPMQPLREAEAIAGQGLSGDRYLKGTGYYSKRPLPDGGRQITLLETEELERLERETGIRLDAAESRRNVLTRSVYVNGLIGKRFRVGEVVCEGIRICEPCTYLERLTGKRVMRPLVHRGGLRARIVSGGTVEVGDTIWHSPEDPAGQTGPVAEGVHSLQAENVGEVDPEEVQAEGVLRRLESSPSVCGTHYLESGDTEAKYRLLSEDIDLNDFLGVKLRALGYLVDGASDETGGSRLMKVFLVSSI